MSNPDARVKIQSAIFFFHINDASVSFCFVIDSSLFGLLRMPIKDTDCCF